MEASIVLTRLLNKSKVHTNTVTLLLVIAKLLPVTVLPIATIILWQRRTKAHWSSLPFCLFAFGVNYVAQEFLSEPISYLSYHDAIVPILVFLAYYSSGMIFSPWVLDAFLFGLIREGGRWLILRHLATKMRQWQDGVLFGMGYSYLALLSKLEWYFGIISSEHWNQIKGSFTEIVNWVNGMLHPIAVWYFPTLWILTFLFFNVVTSVLVLASVQQKKVRYLLIAIVVYVIYLNAPPMMSDSLSHLDMDWLGPDTRFEIIKELARFVVPLPFLWLVIRLRKTMSQ